MTILRKKHPELLEEWHPYRNLPRTPDRSINSRKDKIWWICKEKKAHIFDSTLASKVNSRGGGCPYCSGKRVLPEESLSKTHPKISAEWHVERNGEKLPYEYSAKLNARKWWKCEKGEDHEWKAVIYERTRTTGSANRCPFCANRKLSVTNSLEAKNPELAKQFYVEKNKMTARDVIASRKSKDDKKMWWICSENPNHEWLQYVAVRHNQNSGCPGCKHKWESRTTKIIEEVISRKAKISIESQHYLGKYYFDIRIDLESFARADGRFLIELDGEQHYKDMPHWGGHHHRDQRRTDKGKTELAKEKGFIFGRIPYWIRTKTAVENELFNIFGKAPTFSSVPNDQEGKTQKQPELSASGSKWLGRFEQ